MAKFKAKLRVEVPEDFIDYIRGELLDQGWDYDEINEEMGDCISEEMNQAFDLDYENGDYYISIMVPLQNVTDENDDDGMWDEVQTYLHIFRGCLSNHVFEDSDVEFYDYYEVQ